MPGSKYVIIGCNISRKHELALFQIPAKDDEYNTVWRNSIIDAGLKEQIDRRALYICERHYTKTWIKHR